MKKRLLVTGASGFLGHNILRIAPALGLRDIIGVYNSHEITPADGVAAVKTDITDPAALEKLFKDVKPQAVIHAAAVSQPNHCEKNPVESHIVNVAASKNIAILCAKYESACVFTSSDQVFDGEKAPYSELCKPCPINVYGRQKALTEQEIKKAFPDITICRMPLMFGSPSPWSYSFITPFINNLKAGKPLNLFTDEIRTPVSARDAAKGLFIALNHPGQLLHLGGKESISRFDFGILLADILKVDRNLVLPALRKDVSMPAPRPRDLTMDSTKACLLGFFTGSIRSELLAVLS
jgi:dTDP-4-dehydrorhamnose reductase